MVLYSPAKMGKQLARRAAAPGAATGDYQLVRFVPMPCLLPKRLECESCVEAYSSACSNVQPNHDYCDACGGKGQFLCCEGGCLRSFHFTCLEPPLELEEVPEDESWFCKACRAAAVGLFDPARCEVDAGC